MKNDRVGFMEVISAHWVAISVLLGILLVISISGCSIPESERHVSRKQAKIAVEKYHGIIATPEAYHEVFDKDESEASNSSEKHIASAHVVKQKEAEKEAKRKRDEEVYRIAVEQYGGVITTKEAYHDVFDNDTHEHSAYDSNGKKTDEERYRIAVEEYGGVISTPEAYQRVFGDD